MSVVTRADHADGALEMSVSLDPTTLMMFGNRARQAELVKALRLIALELPFNALIWQDTTGQTCVSYTDFRWLATRYRARRDVLLRVEQDAAQMIVRAQDSRQQRALAAADVRHRAHR